MLRIARWVHLAAAWLFVAGVLLQGYLAGGALPQLGGSGDFATHRDVGYAIGIVALVLLLAALVGRLSRTQVGLSALVLVLYIVQTMLPLFRGDSPAIAALHPLNAMVLLVVSVVVAVRARPYTRDVPA